MTAALPQFDSQGESTRSVVKCPHCRRWRPEPDDRWCAWCGGPLVVIRVEPGRLKFTRSHPDAVLKVSNPGVQDLAIALEFEQASRFRREGSGDFLLAPGEERSIEIGFDFSAPTAETDYSGTLFVDSNAAGELERILVSLDVERPPKGCLVTLPKEKTVLIVGDAPVVPLGVRNDGGGTLRVIGIEFEPSSGASGDLSSPVEVESNQVVEAEIRLDPQKLVAGEYTLKGSLILEGGEHLGFVTRMAYQSPGRITAEPSSLHCDLYRILRRTRRELKLSNIGGKTVRIGAIRCSRPWARGHCKVPEIEPGRETYVDVTVELPQAPAGTQAALLEIESDAYGSPLQVAVNVNVHEMQSLAEAIGIDFGTSVSCVARVRDGDPELVDINPEDDSQTVEGLGLPSIVFFDDDFFPLVGKEAKRRARFDPGAAVTSVKRILGGNATIRVRDRDMEPWEIAKEIIQTLLCRVEEAYVDEGALQSPTDAVMTVPADISDLQIKDVLESGRCAGLNVDHAAVEDYILDEPSAAALYYLWRSRKEATLREKELVFIYDFGAGTLDCSLVLIEKQSAITLVKVLATTGDRELGGNDIDLRIVRYLAEQFKTKVPEFDDYAVRLSQRELFAIKDMASYRRVVEQQRAWHDAAEQIKRELSDQSESRTKITFAPGKGGIGLSKSAFETEVLQQFLKRSREVIEGCCAIGKVAPGDVNTILHTGRVSLVPAVRRSVNEYFDNATDCSNLIPAKTCVAMGAAWWAHIKNLPRTNINFYGLEPSLPHSIGYLDAQQGAQTIFTEIFPAGQTCPYSRIIRLPAPRRRAFRLLIQEKKFGIGEVKSRGEVRLAAAPRDEYEFEFQLTANRTLEVLLDGEKRIEIKPSS